MKITDYHGLHQALRSLDYLSPRTVNEIIKVVEKCRKKEYLTNKLLDIPWIWKNVEEIAAVIKNSPYVKESLNTKNSIYEEFNQIEEAIKAVRNGANPLRVFFEGVDSATIDPDKAQQVCELVDDAKSLVEEAADILQQAYDDAPEKTEDIEDGITSLKEIGNSMESISNMVRQNGALQYNSDAGVIDPDQQRDPAQVQSVTEDDEVDDSSTDITDNNQFMVTIAGVQDSEEFKQKLIDLVKEYGGILNAGDDAAVQEGYEVNGTETPLKSGDDVDDETGLQKKETNKMVNDLKSTDDKEGAVQIEHRIVRTRMTEGLKFLVEKHRIRTRRSYRK